MSSEKLGLEYPASNNLLLKFSGDWQLSEKCPSIKDVFSQFSIHKEINQITLDVTQVNNWDSSFISFLLELIRKCEEKKINISRQDLPQGIQKLLDLALKVSKKSIPRKIEQSGFFESVGDRVLQVDTRVLSFLDFLGQIASAFGRLIRGKAFFRKDDFIAIVQKCGSDALPLVSLISLLVGVILAFVGAIQLQIFGAQIFIADIVGIAMVRVMGAVMTGVLMSGRTGASFAAELGLMQTNEEIDALRTLGIDPVEFLVVPRVLALVIMMPLLTLYADFMGILGGFIISVGVLGINPVEYWHHTQSAVNLNNLWVGLIHGFVFGAIIAIAGCLRGLRCERSAAAVGEATTSAVVTAITAIVIATAIITFICQILGV